MKLFCNHCHKLLKRDEEIYYSHDMNEYLCEDCRSKIDGYFEYYTGYENLIKTILRDIEFYKSEADKYKNSTDLKGVFYFTRWNEKLEQTERQLRALNKIIENNEIYQTGTLIFIEKSDIPQFQLAGKDIDKFVKKAINKDDGIIKGEDVDESNLQGFILICDI